MNSSSDTTTDRQPLAAAEAENDPVLRRMADVAPQPVAWLWPGRIPLGKLTLLVGDPGHGKSLLALDIAARVTRGLPWPDPPQSPSSSILPSSPSSVDVAQQSAVGRPQSAVKTPQEGSSATADCAGPPADCLPRTAECSAPAAGCLLPTADCLLPTADCLPPPADCATAPAAGVAPLGKVILLTAEDDLADTVRPRLDAAGADPEGVVHLQAARRSDLGSGRPFSLARDLPALERALALTGGVRLVILDPLTAYFGAADSHHNAAVRGLLGPLAELAARTGVAILAISHLTKNTSTSLLYRTMGSLGFVAQSRAVHVVLADRDDPARRLFLPLKSNLAGGVPGLAYRIASSTRHGGTPVIAWEPEPLDAPVAELLRSKAESGPPPWRRAVPWLRNFLAAGPKPCEEIAKEAFLLGIPENSLLRARRHLDIKVRRRGFNGPWFWSLGDQTAREALRGDSGPPEPRDGAGLPNGPHSLEVLPPGNGGENPPPERSDP